MAAIILTAHAPETVGIARLLAYAVVGIGAAVLLVYLAAFVRRVLVEPDTRSWVLLGLGIGAGVIYGVSGVIDSVTSIQWLGTFVEGATLFLILFLALGIRQLYYSGVTATRALPTWIDSAVVLGFVASWWVGFFLDHQVVRLVVVIGWIGASVWALYYGILAVRHNEGTSIAALVRNLLPAIVAVTVVVFVDVAGSYLGLEAAVDALWLVGTVLVGAFLFTTAVAIRQQGGEVERMYDWTTWRGDEFEEGESAGPTDD